VKLVRRIILALLPGLALSLTLAGAAGPAYAASGPVVYVDDTAANNGKIACPGAVMTNDLGTLTIVANETLYICPGSYKGQLLILGVNNVKVIGKGYPTIIPDSGDYVIIQVSIAQNVTIQGLVLDGGGFFTMSSQTGIGFDGASGLISGNYITRIRATTPSPTCSGGGGIKIDGTGAGSVKVLKNTVVDFQCYGIVVLRATNAIVQNNLVWGSATIGESNAGISGYDSPNMTIANNTIGSDWNPLMTGDSFTAIQLEETPAAKMVKNKINSVSDGLWVTARCQTVAANNPDNLLVTGNTFTAAQRGVFIQVEAQPAATCAPSSDLDVIKGNTFAYPLLSGSTPVRVSTYDNNLADTYAPDMSLSILSNKFYGTAAFYGDNAGPGITILANSGNKLIPPPDGS
jgi:hypothetical protein